MIGEFVLCFVEGEGPRAVDVSRGPYEVDWDWKEAKGELTKVRVLTQHFTV